MSYPVLSASSRIIVFTVLLWFGLVASAQATIRDTEIENALRVYMQPLLEAAGLSEERLKITVVSNPEINAAVLPGGQIIVHTGLLTQAEDPTEVAGVLAHELGHYVNNDVLKLTGKLSDSGGGSILGTALGLGLSIAAGDSRYLNAGAFAGKHIEERNVLQFSRSMESGADRRAAELLHRSGIGLSGIVALNKRIQEIYPDPDMADAQYMRTHPLTQARIEYFSHQHERLGDHASPSGWQAVHDRVRAKLHGFEKPPGQVLELYPADNMTLPARMARAIALMRLARYDESTDIMEQILIEYPEDGFLYDLMGDIQRLSGQPDRALQYYTEAIKRLPWAALIRQQRAELWLKKKTPEHAEAARDDLVRALRYEPDVPVYWHNLAQAHRILKSQGAADLALAEAAILEGKENLARSLARRAKESLEADSADWIRADDIMNQGERP